ncbi:unnamed protein product [Victoria cruziana]
MHQKKSELQIGTESRGISSDFSRVPPLHHHHLHQYYHQQEQQQQNRYQQQNDVLISAPHKRAMISTPSSLSRSPTLSSLPTTSGSGGGFPSHPNPASATKANTTIAHPSLRFPPFCSPSASFLRFLRRLSSHHYYYHHHLKPRLLLPPSLIVAIPTFWWFIKTSPSELGLWFDFFSAFAFAAALLLSFRFSFPRLTLVRLIKPVSSLLPYYERLKSKSSPQVHHVKWTIGSKPKSEKAAAVNAKEGVIIYSNGDVYEGEFHQGKCSGSGVYYYCMSGRYEGDWVDGKYDGYGVETWARGSRYRGQYRQGLRHGYGIYKFYTGDVYAGEWSNGQSHGCGVHTCEDGSRYVGEFKWGVKHGLGHYHFRNGDTYAGEYFADKMHGFGVYRFANGHRYEGAWHEGRKQGLGMYTFRNGEARSGHWQNGSLETPSTQNMHPGSPVAVNHSKVLNAVQVKK